MTDFAYATQSDLSMTGGVEATLSERIHQVRAQVAEQQTIDDLQQQRLDQHAAQIEVLTDAVDKLKTEHNADDFFQQNGATVCLIYDTVLLTQITVH